MHYWRLYRSFRSHPDSGRTGTARLPQGGCTTGVYTAVFAATHPSRLESVLERSDRTAETQPAPRGAALLEPVPQLSQPPRFGKDRNRPAPARWLHFWSLCRSYRSHPPVQARVSPEAKRQDGRDSTHPRRVAALLEPMPQFSQPPRFGKDRSRPTPAGWLHF